MPCVTKHLFCARDYARHFCTSPHLDLPAVLGSKDSYQKSASYNSKHNKCKWIKLPLKYKDGKRNKETFGVMNLFISFAVMIISCVCI